jgi:hypothetical protein
MMKNPIFLIFLFIVFSLASFAQQLPFTNINANLEGLGFSNGAWGDFDNDGDLDILMNGEPLSTIPVIKIYRNDAGSFTDLHVNLYGYTFGSVEWGDYDNDSDLDLLITGNDSLGNPSSGIFRNDNGNFTNIQAALPSISEGNATWGDFDNDNDLDILLAGNYMAKILRNDGNGSFTDMDVHFPMVRSAFCNWVDYNNDGLLDAFVVGDLGGVYVAKLYKNIHGSFEEDSVGFMGLSASCAKWGDLNNDGYKDLVLAGMDPNLEGNFLIYRNNGNGQFDLIDNYTFGVLSPNVDLGDYDNDGYLDIILIGRIQGCGGNSVNMLYHNDGNFVFSDVSTLIQGFRQGSASWGDYNNDGYADLLFNGFNGSNLPQAEIYINNAGSGVFTINTPPSCPGNLESGVDGNTVQLRWSHAADEQTPSGGLTYNVYIGSSQDNADILNPLSDLTTGFRKVAKLGNANKDTTITIHDLDAGSYFWSVQAVDNGFLGSSFTPEEQFTVLPVGLPGPTNHEVEIYPNPFYDRIYFRDPDLQSSIIQIYNLAGQIILETKLLKSYLDLSLLNSGIYYLRILDGGEQKSSKLIKR